MADEEDPHTNSLVQKLGLKVHSSKRAGQKKLKFC